jgi:Family of unknown function (DUF5691)
MQEWNNILQLAMLGTGKNNIGTIAIADEAIQTATQTITTNATIDAEEKYLQLASVVYNYKQIGALPALQSEIVVNEAEAEIFPICNAEQTQTLKDILSEENKPLLESWFTKCAEKKLIVEPILIPALFDIAKQNKKLQTNIVACCGKRGEWMMQYQADWQFAKTDTDDALWQLGILEQRIQVLKNKRTIAPDEARALVVASWPTEDAATKMEFLKIMHIIINESDIAFLESLQNEKSKKVKEEAVALLKKIPESTMVKQFMAILSSAISIRKEKTMLGLSSKMVLDINLPPHYDEVIFKYGIEKLSSSKEVSDNTFILQQLIRSVPPKFWENHLQISASAIIEHLQNIEAYKIYAEALALATANFNDKQWAAAFQEHSKIFYIDILPLLSIEQQEKYSIQYFEANERSFIHYTTQKNVEWSNTFALKVLTHTASMPYEYNKSFYANHIIFIPVNVSQQLQLCMPTEDYSKSTWVNQMDYIKKLLQLKSQTIKSFS